MKKQHTNFIIIPSWIKLLPLLNKKNTSDVSYDTRITYSHVVKCANEFGNRKWVTSKKKGRDRIYKLTNKGKRIADLCERLTREIK